MTSRHPSIGRFIWFYRAQPLIYTLSPCIWYRFVGMARRKEIIWWMGSDARRTERSGNFEKYRQTVSWSTPAHLQISLTSLYPLQRPSTAMPTWAVWCLLCINIAAPFGLIENSGPWVEWVAPLSILIILADRMCLAHNHPVVLVPDQRKRLCNASVKANTRQAPIPYRPCSKTLDFYYRLHLNPRTFVVSCLSGNSRNNKKSMCSEYYRFLIWFMKLIIA